MRLYVERPQVLTKPAYRVPSMAEINAIEPTGATAVSTFSGAGGSCLGLKMCGVSTLFASEFVKSARRTYRANFPNTVLDKRNIREVTAEEILEAIKLDAGELDILEGSPPCQSFSTSGTVNKGWGTVKTYSDKHQRTDDLFFEFVRLLDGLQPRAFIAENVHGLSIGKSIGYFKEIFAALEACGYAVEVRELDAQWLGVPQRRKRLIFVGIRHDLNAKPVFPVPFKYRYSIREAFENLPALDDDLICPETGRNISFAEHRIASKARKLLPGQAGTSIGLKTQWNLSRSSPYKPSPTVVAEAAIGTANAVHYNAKRKFNIPELRLLTSFPADFELVGSFRQRCERLARAVPPFLMRAVGESVLNVIR